MIFEKKDACLQGVEMFVSLRAIRNTIQYQRVSVRKYATPQSVSLFPSVFDYTSMAIAQSDRSFRPLFTVEYGNRAMAPLVTQEQTVMLQA